MSRREEKAGALRGIVFLEGEARDGGEAVAMGGEPSLAGRRCPWTTSPHEASQTEAEHASSGISPRPGEK